MPFKPFDQLKYARQEVKKTSGNAANYAPGDTIHHVKFGKGMVIESGELTVSAIFDTVGLKKLAKDTAPIKLLEKAKKDRPE